MQVHQADALHPRSLVRFMHVRRNDSGICIPKQEHSLRYLAVEASVTPNDECLRFFSMDLSFLPSGQSMDFPNASHAYKSPLAEALFDVDGVSAVFLADEYISITRSPTSPQWEDLKPIISEVIISFAGTGRSILSEAGEAEIAGANDDTEPEPGDDEVVLAVKELLAARIRPIMQADGGNVRYVGFLNGIVYVLLEGACKTCPSSGATLKNSIERMLMHWIPEVVEVEEISEDGARELREEQKKLREKSGSPAA